MLLQPQTTELSIALTQDEVSFIIELCDHDLDLEVQLKLEFARMWKDKDGTLLLTPTQLQSLIDTLIKKSEQACKDVREWAEDIATWLVEQSHKQCNQTMH